MATSSDSNAKILFFDNNGPPESTRMLFRKNTLIKNISYKENDLINKVKCFSDREVVKNFCSDLPKINIGWKSNKFTRLEYHSTKCGSDLQTFKHDVLKNFCLQISGISRQQTPSMLVPIGAQYSHLHQVLLPILPFTPFVATSLLLARSLTEFIP